VNAVVLLPVLVPLIAAALGLVAWQSGPAQRSIALAGSVVLLATGIAPLGIRRPDPTSDRHPSPTVPFARLLQSEASRANEASAGSLDLGALHRWSRVRGTPFLPYTSLSTRP